MLRLEKWLDELLLAESSLGGQALIIDIEGEGGEASGDPPSRWRGSGVTMVTGGQSFKI